MIIKPSSRKKQNFKKETVTQSEIKPKKVLEIKSLNKKEKNNEVKKTSLLDELLEEQAALND